MLRLVLLLIVPCLFSAEVTCPDGVTTCPEGQACCTVNDKQSCCDEGQLPLQSAMQAATINNSSVQNAFGCSTFTNCIGGTCCFTGACCQHIQWAECCANNKCCPSRNPCCGSGCCQPYSKCCSGDWCCPSDSKCCSEGYLSSRRWCCGRNQRCGMDYGTCYAGAGALSPTTLVTLVAAWLVAYAVKKM